MEKLIFFFMFDHTFFVTCVVAVVVIVWVVIIVKWARGHQNYNVHCTQCDSWFTREVVYQDSEDWYSCPLCAADADHLEIEE